MKVSDASRAVGNQRLAASCRRRAACGASPGARMAGLAAGCDRRPV